MFIFNITAAQVLAAAESDAEFDGRSFDGLSRPDRDRYIARAKKALTKAASIGPSLKNFSEETESKAFHAGIDGEDDLEAFYEAIAKASLSLTPAARALIDERQRQVENTMENPIDVKFGDENKAPDLSLVIAPLIWDETVTDRGDGTTEQTGWEAANGFGAWYTIEAEIDGWKLIYNGDFMANEFNDPDSAKAAAQRHFEKKVHAAISPGLIHQSESKKHDDARAVEIRGKLEKAFHKPRLTAEIYPHLDAADVQWLLHFLLPRA